VNVATKEGEGTNFTCGDRKEGECWKEKLAVMGCAGDSSKAPGRLRIDLVEAALCNDASVGETMPLLKID
jgi:hypothetical protein